MNYISDEIMESIVDCFMCGHGIRATSRLTGIHTSTVSKYYWIFVENDSPHHWEFFKNSLLCGCGRLNCHNGWCSFRFDRSKARQDFMKRWHPNRKTIVQLD